MTEKPNKTIVKRLQKPKRNMRSPVIGELKHSVPDKEIGLYPIIAKADRIITKQELKDRISQGNVDGKKYSESTSNNLRRRWERNLAFPISRPSQVGDNRLAGRPSNNKDKVSNEKRPRSSKIDIVLAKDDAAQHNDSSSDEDDDLLEELNNIPILAHGLKLKFIQTWMKEFNDRKVSQPIKPDPVMNIILGHDDEFSSIPCVKCSNPPNVDTAHHLRKNIKVNGKFWTWGSISRDADRHIRPYHMIMYSNPKFPRNILGKMVGYQVKSDEDDEETIVKVHNKDLIQHPDWWSASHLDGDNSCCVHAYPEPHVINNERKNHHEQLKLLLKSANIKGYRQFREKTCKHLPKCFINPYCADVLYHAVTNSLEYQDQSSSHQCFSSQTIVTYDSEHEEKFKKNKGKRKRIVNDSDIE